MRETSTCGNSGYRVQKGLNSRGACGAVLRLENTLMTSNIIVLMVATSGSGIVVVYTKRGGKLLQCGLRLRSSCNWEERSAEIGYLNPAQLRHELANGREMRTKERFTATKFLK